MKTYPLYDLSIIIVNYGTVECLVRCLDSIYPQVTNCQVIVVDNASCDNSQDMIKSNFPWVNLIANDQNLGFAKANNQALEISKGKYVYFLNPDTEVKPGTIQSIVKFMDYHQDVGLAGTRIISPDGSPQSSVEKRYPGENHTKEEVKGLKGDIAWVLGASMIVRSSIIENLKGFDERFFLYGEDQDLCLRIRKLGWIVGYIQGAVVTHLGGQSERDNLPVEVWGKKFEAELLFYEKHYTKKSILAIRRANLVQAYWRIFTLKLTLPFCRDKRPGLDKLDKYRLVLKTFNTKKIVTV